jgi:endonuclease YncB( thermonuclease family)
MLDVVANTRTQFARTVAFACTVQDRAVFTARRIPFLSRYSSEYLRGATEVLAAVATMGALALVVRAGTLRYKVASDIPKRLFRPPRTIHGYILNVSDGDGVRFYHTPWIRRLLFPEMRTLKKFSDETINVRLAGVDAPEMSHFGIPGQKFGKIAKQWLTDLAQRRRASLQLLGQDQYSRVIGMVRVQHSNPVLRFFGLGRQNLSLELVKAGYAEVYRGPNAQYGGLQSRLEKAERRAVLNKLGFWADKRELTPSAFKKKMRHVETGITGTQQSLVLLPGPLLSKTLAFFEGLKIAMKKPAPAASVKNRKKNLHKT